MLEYLGMIGVIILNFSTVPQIVRIVRLKNSHSISVINVLIAILGFSIMLICAFFQKNYLFSLNYETALMIEVILLIVTLKYRKNKRIVLPKNSLIEKLNRPSTKVRHNWYTNKEKNVNNELHSTVHRTKRKKDTSRRQNVRLS